MKVRLIRRILALALLISLWVGLLVPIGTLAAVQPLTAGHVSGETLSKTGTPARNPEAGPLLEIRLQRATFDPLVKTPSLPSALSLAAYPGSSAGYYLVQFKGPILAEWRVALAEAGATLLDYVPQFAYIVRMDKAVADHLAKLEAVRWIGIYQPAYRVSTALDQPMNLAQPGETTRVIVRAFTGEPGIVVRTQLEALGATVQANVQDNGGGAQFKIELPTTALTEAANLSGVAWIEPWVPYTFSNAVARSNLIMKKDMVEQRLGLYGAGQIVVVGDTGVSTGNAATINADFAGRVFTGTTGPDSTCHTWTDNDEHGTHVAGSVLGSGVNSGAVTTPHSYSGTNAGIAPEALLFAWGVCNDFSGLPADLYSGYFSTMYNVDSRVRLNTNSWGSSVYGQYTVDSRNADRFIWDHPDMTILFAASNDGTDANSDGVVDPDSIGAPGTAKNVITVGASENQRATGGYNPGGPCSSWGTCWPGDYPANPINVDPLSNNVSGMVAFSSRGPTNDGRLKPDIVAPGSNIVSVRYEGTGTGWGVYDSHYLYMGGTSMATPLAAGGTAIVREFYSVTYSITNPTAALLKATLINGAADMTPGQYRGSVPDGSKDDVTRRPDNNQGWGRVDLAGSLIYDAPRQLWFYQHPIGLSTNQEYSATFTVLDNQHPFRVSLVWSDYPGTEAADGGLVNDLDLRVVAPGGAIYYGNDIVGDGRLDGDIDHLNNVEGVDFNPPMVGKYVVYVKGYNVPQSTQPFALVVSGDLQSSVGYLTGQVKNAADDQPVPDATVTALGVTRTLSTMSDASGLYWMPLYSGTYTLTGSAFSYYSSTLSNIAVTVNATTTQDITLNPVPGYIVTGTVTDLAIGWPLYARINIAGYPGGDIWTNPATGFYSVTLPENAAFNFNVTAWTNGYLAASRALPPLSANRTEDFALNADLAACTATGYRRVGLSENFDSAAVPILPSGWMTTVVTSTTTLANWKTSAGTLHPSGVAPHSAPNLVYLNSYNAGSGGANRLYRTVGLNMTTLPTTTLSLWMYHEAGYSSRADRVQVQVSTNGGINWVNVGTAINRYDGSTGWKQHFVDLSAYASQADLRIGLLGISAYGNDIHIDDVQLASCLPQAGGLVVGNAYEMVTNIPLSGVSVQEVAGSTVTAATVDPDVPDSFYTLFAPAGTQTFTATKASYGTVVSTTNIIQSSTVRLDFYLPSSGSYGVIVAPITATQTGRKGEVVTYTLTATNTGNTSDSFTATVSSGITFTNNIFPPFINNLSPNAGAWVTVTVSIPAGLTGLSMSDIAMVAVQSVGDPTKTAVAALTTTADLARKVYLPIILRQ